MIYPILGCAESFKINDLLQAKGLNDNFESSSSEVFCNKASPENLAKATGKLLCRCSFLMKLQATGENSQSSCLYRTIVKFCYYHCLKNLLSLSPYLFPTFNISIRDALHDLVPF